MINNNNRRRNFRPRPQKNNFRRRNGSTNSNNGSFNNGNMNFSRNGSMTNPHSVEKTMQKYQQLAKDAQSSSDPVLVENYLQHADHYARRLAELNDRSKVNINNEKSNLIKEENIKDANEHEEKPKDSIKSSN